MIFSKRKAVTKGVKDGVTTSVAAVVVIQVVLENLMGIEVTKEQLIEVSGALGVLSGAIRTAFNWLKHRKKGIL